MHAISERDYHRDNFLPAPSLSSSILQTLLSESPLHAWTCHPRLNPNYAEDDSGIGDKRSVQIGSAAHKLAIGAGAELFVIEADSYRSKAAQELRDKAQGEGQTPILADDYARAQALAGPLAEAAEDYLQTKISDCLREQVIVWKEGPFWRRIMVDLARPDLTKVLDLKTTDASANPYACAKRAYDAYDVQEAFYKRGFDAIDPENMGYREFAFIFAEQNAPYAISPPIIFSEAGQEMARQKVEIGCRLFDSCLASNRWPGYGSDVYIAEPPSWKLSEWELRQTSDETLNPLPKPENWEKNLELLYGRRDK